jgi:hypothetical protein
VRNSKVSPDLFLPENGIVKGTVAWDYLVSFFSWVNT